MFQSIPVSCQLFFPKKKVFKTKNLDSDEVHLYPTLNTRSIVFFNVVEASEPGCFFSVYRPRAQEVQADHTLPIGSIGNPLCTWIILKTSHFVCLDFQGISMSYCHSLRK